jgi:uncharacterized protein (TIGR02996 family)
MTLIDELDRAIRYDTEDAKSVSSSPEAASLVHHISEGDNVALGAFADLLRERSHPAAPFVERIRDGEGISGDPYRQGQVHFHSAETVSPHYTTASHFITLPESSPTAGVARLDYLHLPAGHFVHFRAGPSAHSEYKRSWLLPISEEDAKGLTASMKAINPYKGVEFEKVLNGQPPDSEFYHERMREAGLAHYAPTDNYRFSQDVGEVLKYVHWQKSDWYGKLAESPTDSTPHLVFADWLQENGDEALAHKVRSEATDEMLSVPRRPYQQLPDDYSDHDAVKQHIHHTHPNPTVRAMAGGVGEVPHPDMTDLLLHSTEPDDHDVAIYLSPEDSPKTHTAHKDLHQLNSHPFAEAGLFAKVVRGTVYLMDHEYPYGNKYGAPSIRFTSPVNDHSEMAALVQHANELRQQRTV